MSQAYAYTPRPIRPLGVLDADGWRIKVTGISAHNPEPPAELVDAARALARRTLPPLAEQQGPTGGGFLYVHEGAAACWAGVDWWESGIALHHRYFRAPLEEPTAFEPYAGDMIACTWELAVTAHERDAWVRAMLSGPGAPDLAAYLADTLSADV